MLKISRSLVLSSLLLAVTGTALSPVVYGQDDAGSSAQAAPQITPEAVVNRLATKLNLTDDQKTQITPIIADRQQKLQELRSDTSMRKMQKMRKAKGIFEDSDKKINAILNDQQRQQYAQLEKQMREEMKQRRQEKNSDN